MIEYAFVTQVLAFLKSGRALVSTVCGIAALLALFVLLAPIDSVRERVDPNRGEVWIGLFVAASVLIVNAITWAAGEVKAVWEVRWSENQNRERAKQEAIQKSEREKEEAIRLRHKCKKVYDELTAGEIACLRAMRNNQKRPLILHSDYDGVALLLKRKLAQRMTPPDPVRGDAYYSVLDEEFWAYFIEREDAGRHPPS